MMNHLRSLSGQSVDSNGDCAYNGSKCAIGVLMTDEEQQDYGDFCDGVIVLLEVIWIPVEILCCEVWTKTF